MINGGNWVYNDFKSLAPPELDGAFCTDTIVDVDDTPTSNDLDASVDQVT